MAASVLWFRAVCGFLLRVFIVYSIGIGSTNPRFACRLGLLCIDWLETTHGVKIPKICKVLETKALILIDMSQS